MKIRSKGTAPLPALRAGEKALVRVQQLVLTGVAPLLIASGCQPVVIDYMTPEEMFEKALENHEAGLDAPVTAEPVASAAAPGKTIQIFTQEPFVQSYIDISTQTMEPFPVGTTILRKIYAEDGTFERSTAMVRADPELYSELGGWVFAVFDTAGQVVMNENQPQMGELDACVSCHLPRANTEFLFGLP